MLLTVSGFHGQLRPLQEEAVAHINVHDEGILCAPTAFGKTAVAAWLIAGRKVNSLVLVHRQQLMDQWRERLAMFLRLPAKSIGEIGGGKTNRTGCVDVAVIQSLHRKETVKHFVAEYGQVIVDECHHISAFTFEQVMRQVKARYVVGLTRYVLWERGSGRPPLGHPVGARQLVSLPRSTVIQEALGRAAREFPCGVAPGVL